MSIYFDTSTKSSKHGNRRHNCWRLDIVVNGKRIRKRSKDKAYLEKIQDGLKHG